MVHDVNSGAVHRVEVIVADILKLYETKTPEAIIESLSPHYSLEALKEALEEIKVLVEEELLYSPDHYIASDRFRNKSPVIKALCLHVAHDCNINCTYCFASQGEFKGPRSLLDFETGKKALDFLVDRSGNRRNLEVDFFGGEPLMNFQVVKDLVDYGRSIETATGKNFRFTLTTNAVLLDDAIIDYVNEHMHNVVLSIDGRKETNDRMRPTGNGKGTYDVIVPKIKALVEKRGNKSYYVRGTFTHHNLDFSEDVLHLADLGFKNTSIEPVVSEPQHAYTIQEADLPQIKSEYEKLAEAMIKRKKEGNDFQFFHFNIDLGQGPCLIKRVVGCGAGSEYVAVTPEGDIYPCHQFVGQPEFSMGNLHQETFNGDIATQFADAHVYSKETCQTCWAKFYCSGGCHANAFNFNQDIMVPYSIGCEMEKKRIECALYIQAATMEVESD
jgi:uncharacterized protein